MRRLIDGLAAGLNFGAAACVLVLMFGTAVEVARRKLVGVSFAGFTEYSEVLLVGLLYLSLAHALRTGAHVEVDSVARLIPDRLRRPVEAFGTLAVLLFLLLATWVTADRAIDSVMRQEFRMGLTQVPIWPARLVIPVGLAALSLQFMVRLWDQLTGRHLQGPEELVDDPGGR